MSFWFQREKQSPYNSLLLGSVHTSSLGSSLGESQAKGVGADKQGYILRMTGKIRFEEIDSF